MPKSSKTALQNTTRNDLVVVNTEIDSLAMWIEAYFHFEVTTLASSQKVQRRDLATFLMFMIEEAGSDKLENWSPRLTQAYKNRLQKTLRDDGTRRWNDRTINRMMAHLKTLAR